MLGRSRRSVPVREAGGLGAAVLDSAGRVLGAISVSALVFDLPLDVAQPLGGQVVATAKEIGAALNGSIAGGR
jgi:DNA-binding IclR family transcriptional regulator